MDHKLFLRRVSRPFTPGGCIKLRMWQERGGTLDKMLIILPEKKVIYTVIPKAANSTIKKCLWSASGVEISEKNINSSIYKNPGPSRRVSETSNNELAAMFEQDDWFKFSFVRNPYGRLISAYKDKILGLGNPKKSNSFLKRMGWSLNRLPTFEEFINTICDQKDDAMDWHWMSQHQLLMTDIIHYNFIGKLEDYSNDMKKVLLNMDVSPFAIEALTTVSLNKTKDTQSDKISISDDTAEKIARRFHEDFDRFNYDVASYKSI